MHYPSLSMILSASILALAATAIAKDVPLDPWGKPYNYKSPGEHGEFDLWSFGKDGLPGGKDEAADVTSW